MNKQQRNITSPEELEQEERRVRLRIRKREAELMLRMKKLPEEVVAAAAVSLISGILEGQTLKTIVNYAKKLGKTLISRLFKET